MALATGTRFGAYEITGPLGAGGMGEVYRATDTHLKRDVAIKVLPASFAEDADRLARFQREAEVLASLNHPNIAQVYGLEKSAGTSALILELVEGPTLAERVAQGPIPPDEALHIALQIAEALEAAHTRNIVHRDLKPANVKLTPDGTVKVLDFGIAKAIETQALSGPQAPSLTTPAMTQAGILLGTAAYMAPEQARGKPVDQRADIWAYGCVLYEMLTGQPAFGGEDVPMTLARVLANDTDLKSMPAAISPAVRHTIRLCLEKDVKKRIADIRDVKLALVGAFDRDDDRSHVAAGPRVSRTLYGSLAAIVALVAAIGFYFYALQPSAPVRRVERFALNMPEGKVLGIDTQSASIAISPDGTQIAFPVLVASNRYDWYVRRLDELAATPLRGAEAGEGFESPFFSPDGRWIGFAAGPSLVRVSSAGAPAITISRLPENNIRGASWGDDNTILVGTDSNGLLRVRGGGGEPEQLTTPAEGSAHRWPHWLPGGRAALFTIIEESSARIALLDVESREIHDLIEDGSTPSYSSTGHIVYAASDGSLRAVAFDLASRRVTGDPVPLLDNLAMTGTAGAHYALATDGSLVYVAGRTSQPRSRLVWVDRDGREEPIAAPVRNYTYADISPDGRRIALDIREPDNDIWIWDVERETLARLTTDDGPNFGLAWSPDSERVAFQTPGDGEIYWQAADGASAAQPLGVAGQPSDITLDGRIIYSSASAGGSRDVLMASVDRGSPEPTPLLASSANERNASVSPNGRFIAYNSNESGRPEVYVRPFPDVSGGRWQISTTGGTRPIWNPNGTELVYFDGPENPAAAASTAVMAVPIEYDPVFRAGVPRKLFEGEYLAPNADLHTYDMAPDGQRFVMIKAAEADEQVRLILVQSWVEELKRLVPANR
jgi:Tol biopolymer transport system component